MMSINENQPNNELKGNVRIDASNGSLGKTIQKDGVSFKNEFDKLISDNSNTVDTSLIASSLGLYPLFTPEFTPDIQSEEFDSYFIDTKTIDNKDAMFFLNISSRGEKLN